jgi:hypothetical protein
MFHFLLTIAIYQPQFISMFTIHTKKHGGQEWKAAGDIGYNFL